MGLNSNRFPNNLPSNWKRLLAPELEKDYFKNLARFLKLEDRNQVMVFPKKEHILRALQMVDFPNVRVVVLGQDPYHGDGQAIGMSFAVPNKLFPKPPSLKNIFKELENDLGQPLPPEQIGCSDLTGWAKQGVLLLNTVLTVRRGQAFSHHNQGWEIFTDRIIGLLNDREKPLVFLLWGAQAQSKKRLITNSNHFVIQSAHPSPLSAHRGFLGSKPFSKINELLESKIKSEPICWSTISVE